MIFLVCNSYEGSLWLLLMDAVVAKRTGLHPFDSLDWVLMLFHF